jgi:hypothetical protein
VSACRRSAGPGRPPRRPDRLSMAQGSVLPPHRRRPCAAGT